MTVGHFTLLERALEVSGHEVPPAEVHVTLSGDSGKHAEGREAEISTVRLVIIDAFDLVAALHAQARFQAAVALDLEDPDEFDQAAVSGHLMDGDPLPRPICLV